MTCPVAHPEAIASRRAPLRDVDGRGGEGTLFDDDSRTTAAVGAPLDVTLPDGPKRVRYYTLTSGPDGAERTRAAGC